MIDTLKSDALSENEQFYTPIGLTCSQMITADSVKL